MRSAHEMGIKTVAVYSEADRNALHTRYADEAVFIGPPPSTQSYLVGESIIEAAKKLNVDAIHPGYGFLSENAGFAEQVSKAGLIFIGPSPESIRIMGDKLSAKKAVSGFEVPQVPGTDQPVDDVKEASRIAEEIGFPLLIKASAGGGGKGMRIVHKTSELKDQMERAVSEAESAFGDGSVFLEKYVTSPRHIEFQILGDQHGNIIHLFERECTIQRRHQKVVEEAPSAVMTEELRERMGNAAIEVARSCNYFGAGTVEFIVDENLDFYFLEMNTRLQVEHPVTELITGVDLVKHQIRIAEGKELTLNQEDLERKGHAIELRVYAEDPANDFLPDIGTLHTYKRPQGPGVRVDDGFEAGMQIPVYYDPMISKLIVYGKDRDEAIVRMKRAIIEYKISGVETTLSFGQFVMNHDAFITGDMDTHFIERYYTKEAGPDGELTDEEMIAAVLAGNYYQSVNGTQQRSNHNHRSQRSWKNRLRE